MPLFLCLHSTLPRYHERSFGLFSAFFRLCCGNKVISRCKHAFTRYQDQSVFTSCVSANRLWYRQIRDAPSIFLLQLFVSSLRPHCPLYGPGEFLLADGALCYLNARSLTSLDASLPWGGARGGAHSLHSPRSLARSDLLDGLRLARDWVKWRECRREKAAREQAKVREQPAEIAPISQRQCWPYPARLAAW